MEFAVDPKMPTYSGGLGILAGDVMHTAADLGISAVGVTLLHRNGYFQQHLDSNGNQSESNVSWSLGELKSIGKEHSFSLDQGWCKLLGGETAHG